MNKILNIFVNPFLISIPITLVVFFLLPSLFSKYNIDIVRIQKQNESQVYFHDIDNDSFSECIYLGYDKKNHTFPCLKCWTDVEINKDRKLIDQYNSDKVWLPDHNPIFDDFDNDHFDEIFFFEYSSDSLFLKGIDPLGGKNIFLDYFIGNVDIVDSFPDFWITYGGFYDLNSDGYKEFIFCISAGFSLEPRAIYTFDLRNNELIINDLKYAYIYHPKIGYDKSSGYVITTSSLTPENAPGPYGNYYCDAHSRLFVFNDRLKLLFQPIVQKRRKSSIISTVINEGSELFIYAIFNGETNNDTSWLIKYNKTGEEIKRVEIFNRNYRFLILESKDKFKLNLYNSSTNVCFEVTNDLEFINKHHNIKIGEKIEQLDLNDDGSNELITCDIETSEIIIYQNGFKHPLFVNFPEIHEWFFQVSKCNFKDESANLYIQSNGIGRYYLFLENDLYYFKYPFYFLVYLLISMFLFFLLQIQKQNLQKKFEQEKRMTELELLTIKNQIDPHFTFNAINTLSSIFYKEDKETAHKFLVDFSSLIRNTLNNSKKIAIPLKDEIDFVQNYLKLQQFRYSNKFDFEIHIDKEVDRNIIIPRMIIQTFAENAVKHGLVNKEGKGRLDIDIHPMTPSRRMSEPQHLQIDITDDGIGREKSKQVFNYKQISTGKGHEIIKQIVDMYNKLNKASVGFEIIDLSNNDGSVSGTKVEIRV